MEINVSVDSRRRPVVLVNGNELKLDNDLEGIRFKYIFESDGKKYIMKMDYCQTKHEIDLLNGVKDSDDARFFIGPVMTGEASHSYITWEGFEETRTVHYIVQEFVEFHKPFNKLDEAWKEVEKIAAKYNLSWDLRKDFRNWAFVGDRPVIYDAVPNY